MSDQKAIPPPPEPSPTKLCVATCAWRTCRYRASARTLARVDVALAEHLFAAHQNQRPA